MEWNQRLASVRKAAGLTQEQLGELNFLDVKFEISVKDTGIPSANGFDDVEFMISTNPGEPMKPLGENCLRRRTFQSYACH